MPPFLDICLMHRRTQITRECTPGLDPWTLDMSVTTVEVGSNRTRAAWATEGAKVQAWTPGPTGKIGQPWV